MLPLTQRPTCYLWLGIRESLLLICETIAYFRYSLMQSTSMTC